MATLPGVRRPAPMRNNAGFPPPTRRGRCRVGFIHAGATRPRSPEYRNNPSGWRQETRSGLSLKQTWPRPPGSSSVLILLAKSEIRMVYVRHELENQACQRTDSCETDFASRITFGDDGWSAQARGGPEHGRARAGTHRGMTPRAWTHITETSRWGRRDRAALGRLRIEGDLTGAGQSVGAEVVRQRRAPDGLWHTYIAHRPCHSATVASPPSSSPPGPRWGAGAMHSPGTPDHPVGRSPGACPPAAKPKRRGRSGGRHRP
jgi:hypothetical protein